MVKRTIARSLQRPAAPAYLAGRRSCREASKSLFVLLLALALRMHPAGATTLTLKDTSYPIPASGAFFVSPDGKDGNPGTEADPFQTIGAAVLKAPSGSTIVIRAGIYRETVNFAGKKLTLQPYPREKVWMNGAVVVTSWAKEGSTWRKDGWTYKFIPSIEPEIMDPAYPMARYPDQAFIDGMPLKQVGTKAEVTSGTFFVDEAAQRLYIGDDPAGKTVEASAYVVAIHLGENADGSVVRGLGFTAYAPHYEFDQYAMVYGAANDLVFENNTFSFSACGALLVVGTNAVIRGNSFVNNGAGGVGGWKAHGTLVEGNYIARNNTEHFKVGWDAAGSKFGTSDAVVWRGNVVEDNLTHGLWCDWSCHNAVFVRNVIRNNAGNGIEYEKSSRALIASNIFQGNTAAGVSLNGSNDNRIYNNTFSRNRTHIFLPIDDRRTGDPLADGITRDNSIINNIFSNNDGSDRSFLHLDDYMDAVSGDMMISELDYDAYHRTTSAVPRRLIGWETGAVGDLDWYEGLAAFRVARNRETHGIAIDDQATNPFFIDETKGDFRLIGTSVARAAGRPLPADIANAINAGLPAPVVAAGAPVDRGAIAWATLGNGAADVGDAAASSDGPAGSDAGLRTDAGPHDVSAGAGDVRAGDAASGNSTDGSGNAAASGSCSCAVGARESDPASMPLLILAAAFATAMMLRPRKRPKP